MFLIKQFNNHELLPMVLVDFPEGAFLLIAIGLFHFLYFNCRIQVFENKTSRSASWLKRIVSYIPQGTGKTEI